ncbi:MAG TPA: hypothetical protein VJX89_01310 [Bacteroidales bacterium]|nr:hypothetical protein [Bacteroidales bacterium]
MYSSLRYSLPVALLLLFVSCSRPQVHVALLDTQPEIFPDYKGVTVPVNIAPLHFTLEGHEYRNLEARIEGQDGVVLNVRGRRTLRFPGRRWARLLEQNAGDSLVVMVKARHNGIWYGFEPFSIYVNSHPIDHGLVYRHIAPGYEVYSRIGIYQRELSSFRTKALYENTLIPQTCVNCHSFKDKDPEYMTLHVRGEAGGTVLQKGREFRYLDSRTEATASAFSYPAWHPEGRFIAYSLNKTFQSFHVTEKDRVEVYDLVSDIVIYDTQNNCILAGDHLTTGSFETFPKFSADGRSLYFCLAEEKDLPTKYKDLRYNLCRVDFNPETGETGKEIHTVIDAVSLGKSISQPVPSPDGRFLLFTLLDYGTFPINHRASELALLDLKEGTWHLIEPWNSPDTESYPVWSSNSRWIVFSSRRRDGLLVLPYIGYMDEEGKVEKPFLLPQKDPGRFYGTLTRSFNCPEFVTAPVKLKLRELERKARRRKREQVTVRAY